MGAISATTEKDGDLLMKNNYEYSKNYGISVLIEILCMYMPLQQQLMEEESKDIVMRGLQKN